MGAALMFEDFSSLAQQPAEHTTPENEALEEEKLNAFENGYQAGWDDALRAQNQASAKLSEALRASLSDMSFTREEAFQAFLSASKGLLGAIVDRILPEIAAKSLAPHVVAHLHNALSKSADIPIQVRVAPRQVDPVSAAITEALPGEISVLADADLSDDQAVLALDTRELEIDLNGLVAEISDAVSDLSAFGQEGS